SWFAKLCVCVPFCSRKTSPHVPRLRCNVCRRELDQITTPDQLEGLSRFTSFCPDRMIKKRAWRDNVAAGATASRHDPEFGGSKVDRRRRDQKSAAAQY